DAADLPALNLAVRVQPAVGGQQVGFQRFRRHRGQERTDALKIVVASLEPGRLPVIEFGRHRDKPFAGKAAGDAADIAVDSKSLLQNEEPRKTSGTFRPGQEGVHAGAVGYGYFQRVFDFHDVISPLQAARRSLYPKISQK